MSQYEFNARPEMMAVDTELIARQPTMTKALQLCQTLSGLDDKQFIGSGGVVKDQAQWSRIMNSGQHNFPQDGLNLFMDRAGNEAPFLWLAHSRGYDLNSLRKRETETERALRLEREKSTQLQERLRYLESITGRVVS
ncbi:hypothetical protein J2W88_003948 [Acidovorax delafieldii]|uniref:Uncharacterized protein n=1 Tax=Acidovorax delafieldii TaxID=47920 RepID=A0AAJ2F3B8_ACIDE|nr:hypothetical protein [Acidovorax delafieldii]MDR6768644.1 hypothetical protein [Acidovorax delafieldii]MDR6837359.1 hypothetical protein [Acidovorax delafieldii]MDR7366850.1 hypothetical protein [Acidovorax delafieldii]